MKVEIRTSVGVCRCGGVRVHMCVSRCGRETRTTEEGTEREPGEGPGSTTLIYTFESPARKKVG